MYMGSPPQGFEGCKADTAIGLHGVFGQHYHMIPLVDLVSSCGPHFQLAVSGSCNGRVDDDLGFLNERLEKSIGRDQLF